jgi:Fe2+ transport system protein FeoA
VDVIDLPLTECEAGEEGEVVTLDTDAGLGARLRELGLVPGASVRVARSGSPMIVEVGSARLCLRGEEASHVRVRIALCPGGIPALAGVDFSLE